MSQSLNLKKFDCFLQVAGQLNRQLQIIPVLYGSLGLNRATLQDGYRQRKGKRDTEKIRMLEQFLEQEG